LELGSPKGFDLPPAPHDVISNFVFLDDVEDFFSKVEQVSHPRHASKKDQILGDVFSPGCRGANQRQAQS